MVPAGKSGVFQILMRSTTSEFARRLSQITENSPQLAPSRQPSYHPARASASRAKAIKRHEPSRDSEFACEGPIDVGF
jgi:hypothetical protein